MTFPARSINTSGSLLKTNIQIDWRNLLMVGPVSLANGCRSGTYFICACIFLPLFLFFSHTFSPVFCSPLQSSLLPLFVSFGPSRILKHVSKATILKNNQAIKLGPTSCHQSEWDVFNRSNPSAVRGDRCIGLDGPAKWEITKTPPTYIPAAWPRS